MEKPREGRLKVSKERRSRYVELISNTFIRGSPFSHFGGQPRTSPSQDLQKARDLDASIADDVELLGPRDGTFCGFHRLLPVVFINEMQQIHIDSPLKGSDQPPPQPPKSDVDHVCLHGA